MLTSSTSFSLLPFIKLLKIVVYGLGTVRGCGWQKIGAFINLGSYYLAGIPAAILLAFVLHIGGKVKLFTQISPIISSPNPHSSL